VIIVWAFFLSYTPTKLTADPVLDVDESVEAFWQLANFLAIEA